ncbi:DUF5667 domain-containing protein [Nocardioides sp. HM23]|uniref:DUF5667 domain-containing protein n=1 Tax=Nocardioides bizhenqiangii TaxID=3095076 RepID=UPI002ACA4C37|nr:DUF5667 domain-containing protein [Nocardioides sp. HM23]MDZ5622690.1 DUF5667 domain-containing protein [Nocardioides sp. HM23]
MTRAFGNRRRAEEFDALVSAPARAQVEASQDAELLDLVGSLRSMPEVSARPDFVSELRSQLVVEAARMARPVVDDELRLRLTPRQRSGARERRAATLLGGFAIVAATGSMAMASQAALPGEVLYPVKRAIENAQTNLQSDDTAKAQTLIAHAQRRLQEAEQLTAEGADADTVAETLQDFTDQSNQAAELALDDYTTTGDQDAIGDLRSFANDSMDDLDALGEVVPADARPALITAAQSVLQADSAAFQVCPTCGDGPVTELPEFATRSAASVSDLNGLLSAAPTGLSVDIRRVEELAGQLDKEPKQRQEDTGGIDDETATDTDPGTEVPGVDPPDTDGPKTPIKDLGDKIKDDLNGDEPGVVDPVEVISGVVSGVGGLVDGLLGTK